MTDPEFKIKQSITIAILLFIFDALIVNQGVIAGGALFVVIFWLLPKSVFLHYKHKSPRVPLTKALIYGLMALAVFAANFANNQLAASRAEQLIVAIEAYHQSTGAYPEKLTDLVPSYIKAVPTAKYALISGDFWYINNQDNALLLYMEFPPFGRPTYDFKRQTWFYAD